MAVPPQTPGYRRWLNKEIWRRVFIFLALLCGGSIVITPGNTVLTTFGVVLIVVSLLIAVRWVIVFNARVKKDRALREPGTAQLLTAATSPVKWGSDDDECGKLTSDIQIRLDRGHTFSGSYHSIADAPGGHRAEVKPFDAWFRVGASLRCLYNPTNPDQVLVFPFAARVTRLRITKSVLPGRIMSGSGRRREAKLARPGALSFTKSR
jgi:hypothetical protein